MSNDKPEPSNILWVTFCRAFAFDIHPEFDTFTAIFRVDKEVFSVRPEQLTRAYDLMFCLAIKHRLQINHYPSWEPRWVEIRKFVSGANNERPRFRMTAEEYRKYDGDVVAATCTAVMRVLLGEGNIDS